MNSIARRIYDPIDQNWARIFWSLTAFVVLRTWIMPLGSGLWLDETGSYYFAAQSWAETVAGMNSLPQLGVQSSFYSLISWLIARVAGGNEVLLRLPSTAAMGLSTFLLYRIARESAGREGAMLCVAFFVVSPGIIFAAADFRPYSLALLAAIASTAMLGRLFAGRTFWGGIGYGLLAALMLHLHYLFGTVLIAHAGYVIWRWRDVDRLIMKQLGIGAVILAALAAPILPNLLALSGYTESLAYTRAPSAASLIGAFIPAVVTVGVFAGLVCASFVHPVSQWKFSDIDRRYLALGTALYISPPLVLFLISTLSSAHVFIARYYLPEIAGLALLGGCLVRIDPAGVRRVIALMVLIAGIAAQGLQGGLWPQHGGDDWPGAIDTARSMAAGDGTAVLIRSGFFAATDPQWLSEEKFRRFLLAPLNAYPLDRPVIVLPYRVHAGTAPYLKEKLRLLASRRRVVLIARFGGNIQTWLDGHLDALGFTRTHYSSHASVSVVVFDRDTDR